MKEYLNLVNYILKNGIHRSNRTKTPGRSIFGYQMRFNLQKGFPLLTTKKVNFRAICHELLGIISGDTNIRYLVTNNVNIGNEGPFEQYRQSLNYQKETLAEFITKIKTDDIFSKKWGNLGPVYGKQGRNFNGVDQLKRIIAKIKTDKNSRRLIVSAGNPSEIEQMLIPPCHSLFQFYIANKTISCQLYQRSADVFLGIPFNIASYALLTHLIAQECNLKVGYFIHTLGDAHIYNNHLPSIREQIKRQPFPLPTIKLNPRIKNIFKVQISDIELINYRSWPALKGKISI